MIYGRRLIKASAQDLSKGPGAQTRAGLCAEHATLVWIKSPLYLMEKKNGHSDIKSSQAWSCIKGTATPSLQCFDCKCDFSQEEVGAWVLLHTVSPMAFLCVLVLPNTLPVGEDEHRD